MQKVVRKGEQEIGQLPDTKQVEDLNSFKQKLRQDKKVFIVDDSQASCENACEMLKKPFKGRLEFETDPVKAAEIVNDGKIMIESSDKGTNVTFYWGLSPKSKSE